MIYVGRMGLALLHECERGFRRHEDGTDTGDYSAIDSTNIFSFYYHRRARRNKGMWGNTKIGVVIHGRIRMCYLFYICAYHCHFLSFKSERTSRTNEAQVLEVTFHILPAKYLSPT